MQKIINQILEGNFDYENGSLDFSCAKIELSIQKGEQYEGSFHIYAAPNLYTEGRVVSSDWRMESMAGEFCGSNEEIPFCFHGETLEEGDVVKGAFYIISNRGEYYLPFVVSVEHAVLDSSIGSIRNLFHFANLAKNNWREAVRMFYSPEFACIFNGNDAQYAESYRALSTCGDNEQNVEEFLIQISKKHAVEFVAEAAELYVELEDMGAAYSVAERELVILRNGWGFTQLFIECRGSFLYTEKEMLTEDDFLENYCRLPVFIDSALCRNGVSYGQIYLYNSYVELSIPVKVRKNGFHNNSLQEKRWIVQLMEYFQAFRLHKISTSAWLKETGRLVEKMVAMDKGNISARLFQAHVLITEGSLNEAGWILDNVVDLIENQPQADTLRAYYLYLTTLLHGDAAYIGRVAEDVERIFELDHSNWRAAWLLLYLSEDFQRSDRAKWQFMEKVFMAGCTSPVLYIEALVLLNGNPALLRRLGRFEQQIFYYGIRVGFLKQEAVEQLVYLPGKVKEYTNVLFWTLERLYENKKDIRLIQEICTLLIKGGKAGKRYFEWYRAGIEARLRITNLYEYYIMSLDMDVIQEIPKAVLLYFSYQNNLDYERSAYLYSYILQHQDKLTDIYETYKPRMEYFVTDQIRKGHISRQLADVYNRLLQSEMIQQQICEPLSRMVFAHLVQVEDGRMRKVYVYQPGNLQPAEYALADGRAWVSLYGSSYTIVFEDAWNNRFIKSVDYTIEKLMIPGKFMRWLLPFVDNNPELDFYLCDRNCNFREEPSVGIQRKMRVAAYRHADGRVKRELYFDILQYYLDIDDVQALDEYMKNIPLGELTAKERGEIIKFMVLRGNLDLAWQWVESYGPYFVEAKILLRLITPIIERRGMEADHALEAAASYVFRKGKYNGIVLEYLALHYQGMTKNMRNIWRAAKAFDLDCYRLSERMLVQMLYTGAYVGEKMDIFQYYLSQGGKLEVEQAFLAQCSYDFFVRERVTEKEIFREIQHMYQRGEAVPKVCKLAFLRFCSEDQEAVKELEGNKDEILYSFLQEMMEEGIHLDCFKAFGAYPAVQQELADKTIIEYHASPRAKVCIHYIILDENGAADGYRAEYMKQVCESVFLKEFVLFFGESIQYYITEEKDGQEQLTKSAELQAGERRESEKDSRYRLINDIAVSKSQHDFDAMDNLLEEYYKKDFLNSRLFVLK